MVEYFNPLTDNLTLLKDSEIEARHADLKKKIDIARRLGNGLVMQQMVVILQELNSELVRRQNKAIEQMTQKYGKEFDELIKTG